MRNDDDGVRRTLAALRRELARDRAAVEALVEVRERREELDELERDLERQLERVRGAAVITLVGATGAGKSTLLNALVGRTVAREGETRPTTSAPVIYRPRDADLRHLVADLPGAAPEVVDYDPREGGPWQEQILIDAPDVNSVAAEHREVVRALADASDVLVVVAHRQSVAELASVSFVDAFAGRRGLVVVLNRADELTPAARDDLLGALRTLAHERWGAPDAPVVATSARRARSEPDVAGWSELCSTLTELVRGAALGRVRRHNAIGTAQRLETAFEEVRAHCAPRLEELERARSEGLAGWGRRVDGEVGERLVLRRAELRTALWNETARRWDGPGGWALRAGGLATLGLGAGAALARRHPLVAAGAAAGTFAADRARAAVRRHELADPTGLLPEPGDLDAWYREELAGARLLARELAGEPTALGVPGPERLTESAAAAVADAWNRLVERDLPELGQRSARWWLVGLVDLPVYALGAWVVGSAAVGFWRGDYVGLDLLLNAALLLLAWLFAARTFVRALLGGRAARLAAEARARSARRLADAIEVLASEGREAGRGPATALERLAALGGRWRDRLAAQG